jgi:hypothetical protein
MAMFRLFVWCNRKKEDLKQSLDSIMFGTLYESKKHLKKSDDDPTSLVRTEDQYQPNFSNIFPDPEKLKYVFVPVTHTGRKDEEIEAIFIIIKLENESSGDPSFNCHVLYPNSLHNPFPPPQDNDESSLRQEFKVIATDIAKQTFTNSQDEQQLVINDDIYYKLPFILKKSCPPTKNTFLEYQSPRTC